MEPNKPHLWLGINGYQSYILKIAVQDPARTPIPVYIEAVSENLSQDRLILTYSTVGGGQPSYNPITLTIGALVHPTILPATTFLSSHKKITVILKNASGPLGLCTVFTDRAAPVQAAPAIRYEPHIWLDFNPGVPNFKIQFKDNIATSDTPPIPPAAPEITINCTQGTNPDITLNQSNYSPAITNYIKVNVTNNGNQGETTTCDSEADASDGGFHSIRSFLRPPGT